jgi:hypothetical protein
MDATAAELSRRINAEVDHVGGAIPEKAATAWGGYLAAMLEGI